MGAGVNIDDLSYVIYRPASGVGPWLGVTHISGEGALQMRFDAQLGIKKNTHMAEEFQASERPQMHVCDFFLSEVFFLHNISWFL